MYIKYKAPTLLLFSALVLVASTLAVTALRTDRSFADPLPSCGAGSTLVPPKGDNPAYCSCPSGQVLVTGNPNTCAATCPSGTVETSDSTGQKSCNQPPDTSCDTSTGANCLATTTDKPSLKYFCGGDSTKVYTSINLGCTGKGNGITDMLFAIIRLLSDGVGFIVVASMVWAGIQYTASRGDPNATAQAIKRIQSNVIALFIFIFGYAILNYVLPIGFLK